MTIQEHMEWLVELYRVNHPGATDGAIYRLMRLDGCKPSVVEMFAQTIKIAMANA